MLETVFCLNTFIVGFTLFFLFDFSFFRELPACALTFVVYEKRYSLPTTEQMTSTGQIMQSSNGRRWAKFPLVVLLPGFIQQQFRLFPDMEKKYVNRAKLTT